jgi:1-acyl-sn-glycerol-3-phosphate acyltransferase
VPVALKTDYWGNGKIIKELGPIDSKKTYLFQVWRAISCKRFRKDENQKIIEIFSHLLTMDAY